MIPSLKSLIKKSIDFNNRTILIFLLCLQMLAKALDVTVNTDRVHTNDLGGDATTRQVIDTVLLNIQKQL